MTIKIALITGAARGIGLATAKRFLAEGYAVALLDIDGETLACAIATLSGRTLAAPQPHLRNSGSIRLTV